MTNEQTSQPNPDNVPRYIRLRIEALEAAIKEKEAEIARLRAEIPPIFRYEGGRRETIDRDIAIRNLNGEIEELEYEIERQEFIMTTPLPEAITNLLGDGTLEQWHRYPRRFFVKGVKKARIIWDEKKKTVTCKYVDAIPSKKQTARFFEVFNELRHKLTA